jgi:hypothetical protein
MRKLAVGGLILGIFGSSVNVVDAGYVIRLKNGNEYVTDRYWHKGTQVLFETFGGVFGVEKTFVSKIAKSDLGFRPIKLLEGEPAATDESSTGTPANNAAEPKPSREAKVEKKRDGNDPIYSEYNRLKERSREVTGMLTSEIRDLLRDITVFRNKLSRDSKLFIQYGQEFNDAQEIAAAVETALRSRTQ